MYEEASVEDLTAIFTATVLRYKKQPVFVNSVGIEKTLHLYDLADMKQKIGAVALDNPELDFTPVPLGFCNVHKDALFLQRTPKRQYKQGLHSTTMEILVVTPDADQAGIKQLSSLKSRSLAHCIEGKYPSIMNAIKLIMDEGYRSVAFARKLAIDSDLRLYFTTQQVGMVDGQTGKILLNRTKKYLERVVHA